MISHTKKPVDAIQYDTAHQIQISKTRKSYHTILFFCIFVVGLSHCVKMLKEFNCKILPTLGDDIANFRRILSDYIQKIIMSLNILINLHKRSSR